MVMSFIPGDTVMSTWFDKGRPTSLEERRPRILVSVAKAVSQLQKFSFDQIGSLRFNDSTGKNNIEIGLCYDWDEGCFGDGDFGQKLEVQAFGPFKS